MGRSKPKFYVSIFIRFTTIAFSVLYLNTDMSVDAVRVMDITQY